MKTKKVIVKDVISSAMSNSDGVQLEAVLDQIMTSGDTVILSLHGINIMTTSFLNSSIGNLVDKYGIEILTKIRLVDYTTTIAVFIKKYISDIKALSAC